MKRYTYCWLFLLLAVARPCCATEAEPTKAERMTAIKVYMARVTDLLALQSEAIGILNIQTRALAEDLSLAKQPKWLIKWSGALGVMEATSARQATLAPVPEEFAEFGVMVKLLGKEVQSWATDMIAVGDGLDAESSLRSQVHAERASHLMTEAMAAARRDMLTAAPLFRPDP